MLSVFDVERWPASVSSSKSSQPSWRRLNHSKTSVRDTYSCHTLFSINYKFQVLPSFMWNVITILCSIIIFPAKQKTLLKCKKLLWLCGLGGITTFEREGFTVNSCWSLTFVACLPYMWQPTTYTNVVGGNPLCNAVQLWQLFNGHTSYIFFERQITVVSGVSL